MAKEAVPKKDGQEAYQRDTIDSQRRKDADSYQYPNTAANETELQNYTNYSNIKNVRSARSTKLNTKPPKKIKKVPPPPVKTESRNIILAWRNFAIVVGATSIIYPIQFFFGTINLVGFGILAGVESEWLATVIDFGTFGAATEAGGGLLILGMAGGFLCGFVGFLAASVVYIAVGKNILHGWSLLILVTCLVGLLLPVISLLPVMLLWYRYMAFAK